MAPEQASASAAWAAPRGGGQGAAEVPLYVLLDLVLGDQRHAARSTPGTNTARSDPIQAPLKTRAVLWTLLWWCCGGVVVTPNDLSCCVLE